MKGHSASLKFLFFILFASPIYGQNFEIHDFGVKEIQLKYEGQTIHALIYSKSGESKTPKPLFLFCQGSQPKPLLIFDKKIKYGVFPFNPDSLANDFHLIVISKPGVPLIARQSELSNFMFLDVDGKIPEDYAARNYLNYYVNRNIFVLKKLRKEPWVLKNKLIVTGHSEGSTIAAKMAKKYKRILLSNGIIGR